MYKSLARWVLTISLCILTVLPSLATADIMMKQKSHQDGFEMMGQKQPAKDVVKTTWITDDKMRSDDEDQSIIVRLDKQVIYAVNHKEKSFIEIPMDAAKSLVDKGDEQAAEMMQMMQGMMKNIKATVTETGEKKKINAWQCTKYLKTITLPMGQVTSEVWATQDIKLDYELFARVAASMMAVQPGMAGAMDDMIEEFKKIKGVPVLTITTTKIMNSEIKSSEELLEVKEDTPPAGTYDLPKSGYKEKSMMPGM